MTEMTAKFARLEGRALIRIGGEAWRDFLQGLLTQEVLTLADGEARYAALLTPQGRLLFELFLHGRPDGAVIEVASARRDDLIMRLKLYRLRAKVEIAAMEGEVFALWSSPGGPGWSPDPRLAQLGFRAVGQTPPPALGAEEVGAEAYDRHRMALGAYDETRDGGVDKLYPIELDLDLLQGIDFKKGCFVGQETTSRMKRRGGIKTRLVPLRVDAAPAPGAEVLAGTLRAGEVLSFRDGLALALLRLDRAFGGPLTVDDRPALPEPPEWLAAHLGAAQA